MRALYKSEFPQNRECLENNIFLSLHTDWRVEPTVLLYITVKNNQYSVNEKAGTKEILEKIVHQQKPKGIEGKITVVANLETFFPASNQKNNIFNPWSLLLGEIFGFLLNFIPQRFSGTWRARIIKMNENPEVCQRQIYKHVQSILWFLPLRLHCRDLKISVRILACGVINQK